MGGLSGVTDTENTAFFYYVGNIVSIFPEYQQKFHMIKCGGANFVLMKEIPFPVFPEYQRKHIKCVAV